MHRSNAERALTGFIVPVDFLHADLCNRLRERSTLNPVAAFAPLILVDHAGFEGIQRIRFVPRPRRFGRSALFDFRPLHFLRREELRLTLVLESFTGDVFGEFVFALQRLTDLLFAVVLVVRIFHFKVGGHQPGLRG